LIDARAEFGRDAKRHEDSGVGPHLGRLRGQDPGHCTRLAELFSWGLAVASGKGRGMMFRRHPGILESRRERARSQLHERRPAAVLFVAAGPLLAGVIEQPLSDVLPGRLRPG
jgi:hypothetical protein